MWGRVDLFDKKLRVVRLRCDVNVLLEQLARVLTIVGGLFALGILLERAGAVKTVTFAVTWAVAGGAVIAVLLLWFFRRPSALQAALLIDRRLGLRERFSTAMVLAGSDDPFCKASVAEAHRAAERLNVSSHFPLRPSRRWFYATVVWLAGAGVLFFVPSMDLLGFEKNRQADKQAALKIEQTNVDIKQVAGSVKMALGQFDDSELKEQLGRLGNIPKGIKPDQVRRQAIRKLGDLSERVKKLQSDKNLQAVKMMKSMMGRLRMPKGAFSPRLNQALAKGDFARASNLVRQFQKQLDEGKLNPQQLEALKMQLANMAEQLRQLARKNEKLEDELEKAGLDKSLAKLTKEELEKALRKSGLSEKKINKLLAKAAACRSACGKCSRLGQAMAGCGGQGGLSVDELAEQLEMLEAMEQDLALTQASLEEIERAISCLGGGNCQGLKMGQGQGQQVYGPRDTSEPEDTSEYKTRVKSKAVRGKTIASWYFKGQQHKGGSARELAEVIRGARDAASESISENRIPRKYESSIKKYFGQIDEQADNDESK